MAGVASREEIMVALLERLQDAYAFAVVGRRNVSPDTIAKPGQPALLLLKDHENFANDGNQPSIAKRTMNVLALCYFDASHDENLVPDSIINEMTDAIEAKIRQVDNVIVGRNTLGGKCHSVQIVGQIDNAPKPRMPSTMPPSAMRL